MGGVTKVAGLPQGPADAAVSLAAADRLGATDAFESKTSARAKRTVTREQLPGSMLSDDSMLQLADRFTTSATSPSQQMRRAEAGRSVCAALDQLSAGDREVLVLRYLEQLSTSEIAVITGISEDGVKSRQRRALERLRQLLGNEFQDQLS